ncbi:MAG: hypothetical protein JWM12_1503 [Ilumatobacteraceae bacterium]|nr:hypothetical protein [Ilumatobacteraceae bacterium]
MATVGYAGAPRGRRSWLVAESGNPRAPAPPSNTPAEILPWRLAKPGHAPRRRLRYLGFPYLKFTIRCTPPFASSSARIHLGSARILLEGVTVCCVSVRGQRKALIRVRCPEMHAFDGAPSSLRVTHAAGVALGYSFWCEQCSALVAVEAPPEHIAMLFEMGVRPADEPTHEAVGFVSERRRLVSCRYLPEAGVITFVTSSDPQELIEP